MCAMNLMDVDRTMDMRYSECAAGIGDIEIHVTWRDRANCIGNFQVNFIIYY